MQIQNSLYLKSIEKKTDKRHNPYRLGKEMQIFACCCLVLFLVTPTPTRNVKFSSVTYFGKAPHSIIIVSV